jgi:hypothetical protein
MARKNETNEGGSATSLPVCASCKKDVGKEAGVIPFFCDDGGGGAGAKHEAFCPQCFVYVRSLREAGRFRPGMFVPIRCSSCKLESVAIGADECGQCRSRNVIVLPPVAGVE